MGGYQKSVFDCLHTNNHKQALIWLNVPPNNNPQLIFCSAGHRETPGMVYESTHLKLLITECIVTCYVNAQPTTTIYNPLRAFRTREKSHNMVYFCPKTYALFTKSSGIFGNSFHIGPFLPPTWIGEANPSVYQCAVQLSCHHLQVFVALTVYKKLGRSVGTRLGNASLQSIYSCCFMGHAIAGASLSLHPEMLDSKPHQ